MIGNQSASRTAIAPRPSENPSFRSASQPVGMGHGRESRKAGMDAPRQYIVPGNGPSLDLRVCEDLLVDLGMTWLDDAEERTCGTCRSRSHGSIESALNRSDRAISR